MRKIINIVRFGGLIWFQFFTLHVTTQIAAFSEFNVLNVKEILGATIQMTAVKRLYYWLRTVL